ncbi:MAG: hypothetical protein DDT34_00515 [Firmicutes bacterium]|nr:hypothetical protein [Bacillota bacterium]
MLVSNESVYTLIDGFHDCIKEVILAGKVPVEIAGGDTSTSGDISHLGVQKTMLFKFGQSRGNNSCSHYFFLILHSRTSVLFYLV